MENREASKVLFRSSDAQSVRRWARVTGACLASEAPGGAFVLEPWMALLSWDALCNGAIFTMCHSSRPKIQVLREPPPIEPAPRVAMN